MSLKVKVDMLKKFWKQIEEYVEKWYLVFENKKVLEQYKKPQQRAGAFCWGWWLRVMIVDLGS